MSSTAATFEPAGRAYRAFWWLAVCLFIWLLGWIWSSSPYMLDDALIHLRYAENLQLYHRITFDGVHVSFGTSSLLYVFLLAGLRVFSTSPVLPRVVSSTLDLALFGSVFAVLRRGLRRQRNANPLVWFMAAALLATMAAPSAVRWLDDGMETGLVLLDTFLGVLLLRRLVRPPGGSVWTGLAAFAYGLFTVLLRVELALLVTCIAGMAVLAGDGRRGLRRFTPALPAAAGALVAAVLIRLTMHAWLPDTAAAKAYGIDHWRDTFRMTGITVLSSVSLGVGLVVLWLVGALALSIWRQMRWAEVAASSLPLIVLLLAARRGQQIQGIRYFGWTLLFPVLWNWLRLAEMPAPDRSRVERWLRTLVLGGLVLLVPAFAVESWAFNRVFAGRNAAFNEFRSQHLRGPARAARHRGGCRLCGLLHPRQPLRSVRSGKRPGGGGDDLRPALCALHGHAPGICLSATGSFCRKSPTSAHWMDGRCVGPTASKTYARRMCTTWWSPPRPCLRPAQRIRCR